MTSYTLDDLIRERNISPEKMEAARNRIDEYVQAYELKEARKAANLTQRDIAARMGVSQKRVSVLESGDIAHVELDTLRRYLKSLGATLSVIATMPDGATMRIQYPSFPIALIHRAGPRLETSVSKMLNLAAGGGGGA